MTQQTTQRWYAFLRKGKHKGILGYVTYGLGDKEVKCEAVVTIPERETPSSRSPTVKSFAAKGFKYIGVVDRYLRGSIKHSEAEKGFSYDRVVEAVKERLSAPKKGIVESLKLSTYAQTLTLPFSRPFGSFNLRRILKL